MVFQYTIRFITNNSSQIVLWSTHKGLADATVTNLRMPGQQTMAILTGHSDKRSIGRGCSLSYISHSELFAFTHHSLFQINMHFIFTSPVCVGQVHDSESHLLTAGGSLSCHIFHSLYSELVWLIFTHTLNSQKAKLGKALQTSQSSPLNLLSYVIIYSSPKKNNLLLHNE